MAQGLRDELWALALPSLEDDKEERQDEERREGGGIARLMEVEEMEEEEIARLTGREWWQCHLGSVSQRMGALHHNSRLFDVILVFPKYKVEMKVRRSCKGKGKGWRERR